MYSNSYKLITISRLSRRISIMSGAQTQQQTRFFVKSTLSLLAFHFSESKSSALPSRAKYNGSKEEQGRQLRRSFFESLAITHNASSIALAHHCDDQQETFFLRLIRGSSIAGLSGIKPRDSHYIRPLLCLYKQELYDYL